MSAAYRDRLYGVTVRSELPGAPHRDAGDSSVDLDVVLGDRMRSTEDPPLGRVVVDCTDPGSGTTWYRFAVADDGRHHLRFNRTCDVVVAADLRRAVVHLVDGADPGLASVLLNGAVLSYVVSALGHPVLHGSAVQVGDRAVAFVGHSGMGKSTMATLMCADGARLVTDDVLRLDLPPGGGALCRLGAVEVRLRKGADDLIARFGSLPGQRRTSDDREALRLLAAEEDLLPLAAIVLPRPDRMNDAVRVQQLSPLKAVLNMLMFPRLVGWQDAAALSRQLEHLRAVCERVPVFVADVPWGPPFPQDVASDLLAAVGLQGRTRTLTVAGRTC